MSEADLDMHREEMAQDPFRQIDILALDNTVTALKATLMLRPATQSLPAEVQASSMTRACNNVLDPVGRLTKSGMLYEGNLAEWTARMNAMLASHNKNPSLDHNDNNSSDSIGGQFISILRSHISPHILSRIPSSSINEDLRAHNQSNQLYFHKEEGSSVNTLSMNLANIAQPFRLMDLPPELRVMCASLAIRARGEVRWSIFEGASRRHIHPITRASRQLRVETLKMAWAQVRLHIDDFECQYMLENNKYAAMLHGCIDFGAQEIKHLRLASFSIRVFRLRIPTDAPFDIGAEVTFQLRLSWSPREGLRMEPLKNARFELTPASIVKLDSHIERVSKRAQECGDWGGAVLVTALTCCPELWLSGALTCVRL